MIWHHLGDRCVATMTGWNPHSPRSDAARFDGAMLEGLIGLVLDLVRGVVSA